MEDPLRRVLSLHCRRTAAVDVLYSPCAGNSAHNSSRIIVQRKGRGKGINVRVFVPYFLFL